MPIPIEYQPATENDVLRSRRSLWIMLVAAVPCFANLVLLARLCLDPGWGDKDIGELLSFLSCALPFVGIGAAITGSVAYLRSAKTPLARFLMVIFSATVLLDICGLVLIACRGVGMG